MATMTYTIKISSTDISSYVKKYKVSYEQLFSNAGRNMAGTMKATLTGTFPKIELTIRPLSGAEMKTLMGLVNNASFSVTWWDQQTETYKTGTFYRGEFAPTMIQKSTKLYSEFTINLIAYSKI